MDSYKLEERISCLKSELKQMQAKVTSLNREGFDLGRLYAITEATLKSASTLLKYINNKEV